MDVPRGRLENFICSCPVISVDTAWVENKNFWHVDMFAYATVCEIHNLAENLQFSCMKAWNVEKLRGIRAHLFYNLVTSMRMSHVTGARARSQVWRWSAIGEMRHVVAASDRKRMQWGTCLDELHPYAEFGTFDRRRRSRTGLIWKAFGGNWVQKSTDTGIHGCLYIWLRHRTFTVTLIKQWPAECCVLPRLQIKIPASFRHAFVFCHAASLIICFDDQPCSTTLPQT